MKLKIVQAGDPILRQQSRPLTREEISSPSIQQLIGLMRDAMREAPGVGLAAPQIGESIQLAVIEDRVRYIADLSADELAERQRIAIPFHVIINPKLSFLDDSSAEFFEGCLSVEGFQAIVDRALNVRVDCLNERTGNDQCPRLVRAHSSARDRPSERNAVRRSNENADADDGREYASMLEQ